MITLFDAKKTGFIPHSHTHTPKKKKERKKERKKNKEERKKQQDKMIKVLDIVAEHPFNTADQNPNRSIIFIPLLHH